MPVSDIDIHLTKDPGAALMIIVGMLIYVQVARASRAEKSQRERKGGKERTPSASASNPAENTRDAAGVNVGDEQGKDCETVLASHTSTTIEAEVAVEGSSSSRCSSHSSPSTHSKLSSRSSPENSSETSLSLSRSPSRSPSSPRRAFPPPSTSVTESASGIPTSTPTPEAPSKARIHFTIFTKLPEAASSSQETTETDVDHKYAPPAPYSSSSSGSDTVSYSDMMIIAYYHMAVKPLALDFWMDPCGFETALTQLAEQDVS